MLRVDRAAYKNCACDIHINGHTEHQLTKRTSLYNTDFSVKFMVLAPINEFIVPNNLIVTFVLMSTKAVSSLICVSR